MRSRNVNHLVLGAFGLSSASSRYADAFCSTRSPVLNVKAARAPKNGARSAPLFANSKNIKAAMEATEWYGIHSPEAKLAWEIVEEFDAKTNDSAAYEKGKNGEGLSPEELQKAYEDVQKSMELMQRNKYAAVSFRNNQQLMKDVAAEVKAIRLSPPTKQPAPTIAGLWDSKLKARALTQQLGTDHPDVKLAWEEVEEIASSGLANAVGSTSQELCDLTKAAEACMALEELDRFLYYENYHVGDNLDNNKNTSDDVTDDLLMADYSLDALTSDFSDYSADKNSYQYGNSNNNNYNSNQNYYGQSYDPNSYGNNEFYNTNDEYPNNDYSNNEYYDPNYIDPQQQQEYYNDSNYYNSNGGEGGGGSYH